MISRTSGYASIDAKMAELSAGYDDSVLSADDVDRGLEDLGEGLSQRLPAIYKTFLAVHASARPRESLDINFLEPSPWGTPGMLSDFLRLRSPFEADRLAYMIPLIAHILPPELFPIARDGAGNLYGIPFRPKGSWPVFFWDHQHREAAHLSIPKLADELDAAGIDTRTMDVHRIIHEWHARHPEALRKNPGYSHVYRVAPDFESFILGLRPSEWKARREALLKARGLT